MAAKNRPMSPHLQIYKPQITSILSITHRITGVGMVVALVGLSWWLIAAAVDAEYFALVQSFAGSWFGYLVMIAASAALFYHLSNGIRHLSWDLGYGLEIAQVERSGYLVLVSTVVLTGLTWAIVIL
ncbi:MAG: succinate dehydrogenase, cytochrome b556 subunit [Alphaproteobacteria bacterium]|jgi:succinate dehydrogenase / fumarate reductase cytochrome b subunit|nr:succinate dehydrogenase, cytochrome b556 subunit [Alphaproteobacteria bacterium]|tara:strand:+ start:342 stop:722 length:381 start_codon:yes stop_codon:yes gene_type:complete